MKFGGVITISFTLITCAGCFGIAKKEFNGIVVKKYLDTGNESFGHVLIVNFETSDTVKMVTTNDESPFYNIVQIGDTVTKKRGKDKIYLRGKKTKGIYDYPFLVG